MKKVARYFRASFRSFKSFCSLVTWTTRGSNRNGQIRGAVCQVSRNSLLTWVALFLPIATESHHWSREVWRRKRWMSLVSVGGSCSVSRENSREVGEGELSENKWKPDNLCPRKSYSLVRHQRTEVFAEAKLHRKVAWALSRALLPGGWACAGCSRGQKSSPAGWSPRAWWRVQPLSERGSSTVKQRRTWHANSLL